MSPAAPGLLSWSRPAGRANEESFLNLGPATQRVTSGTIRKPILLPHLASRLLALLDVRGRRLNSP